MSRVPDEPRIWPGKVETDEAIADLRRQIQAVKAKVEEHRSMMKLAGLTNTMSSKEAEPKG